MFERIKFEDFDFLKTIKCKDYFSSNSYFFEGDKNLQVDAGGIFSGRQVDILVLTHCHFDHVLFANLIAKKNPDCLIYASEGDAKALEEMGEKVLLSMSHVDLKPIKVDVKLKQGDVVDIGAFKFRVVETPGHTSGSICLFDESKKILVSGDMIFEDGIYGRYDLPSSSKVDLDESILKVEKLDYKYLLAGHGDVSER